MTELVSFVVPGEPRGKARARVVRTGHAYTPRETLLAENEIKHYARAAGVKILEGAVYLQVDAHYVVPRSWPKKKAGAARWKTSKPDVDNIVKLVKDALNGVAWDDDAQVAVVHACKQYSTSASLNIRIQSLRLWGTNS